MKVLFVLLTVLLASVAYGQKFNNKLIGSWEAAGADNNGVGLVVKDSAEMYIVYGTERKRITGYKADFTKSPAWFDFMVKDSTEIYHLKSLMQFVNDDLVQWQLFDGAERPDHFTQKDGEMIYLRRKQ